METMAAAARDVGRIDSREIVRDVRGTGSHFFDVETMRFFSSRVARTGWKIADRDGWNHTYVVVTSERDEYTDQPRRYTVRVFDLSDYARRVRIRHDSAGFQGYGSSAAANRAAERVAREIASGVAVAS